MDSSTSILKQPILRVLDIVSGTSVDGPGLRTSIYLAGCAHACPGCHNPSSWDFNGGRAMTVAEVMDVIIENDFNVTLTGGDPLYQAPAVTQLARAIKEAGYTLWLYTGFTLEELLAIDTPTSDAGASCNQLIPDCSELLRLVDVLVDSPFVVSLRDTSLRFRGSSNQRLIDLPTTLATSTLTLHPLQG